MSTSLVEQVKEWEDKKIRYNAGLEALLDAKQQEFETTFLDYYDKLR